MSLRHCVVRSASLPGHKRRFAACLAILAACILSQQPLHAADLVINEFMAVNDMTLADQNGDYSDWIEIYNPTPAPRNLGGWYLTDNAASLTKWQFPSTNLPPNGRIIVFASNKDRRVSGSELHTNFRLDGGGEYLGLVRPDGLTVESAFAPTYPAQVANISYGLAQDVTPLVAADDEVTWHVPAAAEAGTNWTAIDFVDADWAESALGLGFSDRRGQFAVTNYFTSSAINGLADAYAVITNRSLQHHTFSGLQSVVNFSNPSEGGHYNQDVPYPGTTNGIDSMNFVMVARATIQIPTAGDWTFGVWSDDGFELRLTRGTNSYTLAYPSNRGGSDSIGTYTVPEAGAWQLQLIQWDAGGWSAVELFAAKGRLGGFTGDFKLIGQSVTGALPVVSIAQAIGTDVRGAMLGSNASLWARAPFHVADTGEISLLTLRMRYEDGYAAWINGQEVTRQAAPASLNWNSTATTNRLEDLALTAVDCVVTGAARTSLLAGMNVLAIQGLNDAATNTDFLVAPELISVRNTGVPQYFQFPTPGELNTVNPTGVVKDIVFTPGRGFYDTPISLALSCATTNAVIRYTLDGTPPTITHGLTYSNALAISNTCVVRAGGFATGQESSGIETHTYLFLADVMGQPTNPPGFPAKWRDTVGDYQMDPKVVTNPAYSGEIIRDLKAIPTLSIVTAPGDLFDATNGIYANPWQETVLWERPASAELINPDGTTAFQINCGVRMQGNVGRAEGNMKHSLRLLFKTRYGPGKLNYRWFGPEAVDEYDTVILRSGFNFTWHTGYPWATYLVDEWVRQAQGDVGHPAARGTFCHLYLNGLYWGLYNPAERADASYAAHYFGGEKEEYDALNSNKPIDGDVSMTSWWQAHALAQSGITNAARYEALGQRIDIPDLIDYMLVHFYAGTGDWDGHNWYSNCRRSSDGRWRFYSWDSEFSMLSLEGSDMTSIYNLNNPSGFYGALRAWRDFRLTFADHVQKHCFNGGALTAQACGTRYRELTNGVHEAVVGESARWGDRGNPNYAFTRNVEWVQQRDWLLNQYFPGRLTYLMQFLRNAGLFPTVEPASLTPFGGMITNGMPVQVGVRASLMTYYTVNGPDPRVPITGEPQGLLLDSNGVLTLTRTCRVRVRTADETKPESNRWSALNEAIYTLDTPSPLRITELMYNPREATTGEAAKGYTRGDFEFIELQNTGPDIIGVAGLAFTKGIEFDFNESPVQELAPGGYMLLVANRAAFTNRYPGSAAAVIGEFTGLKRQLGDGGDDLELLDGLGRTILAFDYKDGWYPTTDGPGFSLVIRDAHSDVSGWGKRTAWRPSTFVDGTPGYDDQNLIPAPDSVLINEVLSHQDTDNPGDWVELYNTSTQTINLTDWYLSDRDTELMRYRIPSGTVIAAGGYLVLNEYQHFGTNVMGTNGFALSELGDDLYLCSGTTGSLTGYFESRVFGASDRAVSFGRYLRLDGSEEFPAMAAPTPGATNTYPLVGPVVLSEIHYHPAETNRPEFVELYNSASTNVALFDPEDSEHTWRLADAVDYVFPDGYVMAPTSFVVVAGVSAAEFRAAYTNMPPGTPVLGPWAGKLDNAGETLLLVKPGGAEPETGLVPLITVERVEYTDETPWPLTADGQGPSLERRRHTLYANEGPHWVAGYPGGTPGAPGPRIVIAGVTNGTAARTQGQITVTSDSIGPDGVVQTVELYVGDQLLYSTTNPVFAYTWTNEPLGLTQSLSIRMTDGGGTITSPVVRLQMPWVDAGPDQVVNIKDAFALSGSVTLDGAPYSGGTLVWSREAGPASAVISNTALLGSSVRFAEPGEYRFCLSAAWEGGWVRDWVNVDVVNQNVANTIPYHETFEEYLVSGRLGGIHGWDFPRAMNRVVREPLGYTNTLSAPFPVVTHHDQYLRVDVMATNRFTGTEPYTNVWVDTLLKCFDWGTNALPSDEKVQWSAFLSTNGHLVIWHAQDAGTNRFSELPDFTLTTDQWFRLTAELNYARRPRPGVRLWVDGTAVTNPATWFAMVNTNSLQLNGVVLDGRIRADDLVVNDYNNLFYRRITTASGPYGTVDPLGPTLVPVMEPATVTLTPLPYGGLTRLIVDDEERDTAGRTDWRFDAVSVDHTLSAEFDLWRADHDVPQGWLASIQPAWSNDFNYYASYDADGDGMQTWEEYVAGTDPTNRDDALRLDVSQQGSRPMVWFETVRPGPYEGNWQRFYSIQSSPDLTQAAGWLAVPGWSGIPATGNPVQYQPAPETPTGLFYRIQVQLLEP